MKRILLIISALVLGATALHAQEAEEVHAPIALRFFLRCLHACVVFLLLLSFCGLSDDD